MAVWQTAKLVEAKMAAADVRTLRFAVSPWRRHLAGQHYDIRLTAPSGYQAERSYSAASPPEEEGVVEFGVQLLQNGEVSPYLFALKPGEEVEIRGPIGGHFVWSVEMPGPLVLVAGGSGLVPLMAMLRHHFLNPDDVGVREILLLMSFRTEVKILYREELEAMRGRDDRLKIVTTLTEKAPPGWRGYSRRVDRSMLEATLGPLRGKMPMIYICGPTHFVEAVANILVDIGFNSHEVRTERFGG